MIPGSRAISDPTALETGTRAGLAEATTRTELQLGLPGSAVVMARGCTGSRPVSKGRLPSAGNG
jgi:hypothetical protein